MTTGNGRECLSDCLIPKSCILEYNLLSIGVFRSWIFLWHLLDTFVAKGHNYLDEWPFRASAFLERQLY